MSIIYYENKTTLCFRKVLRWLDTSISTGLNFKLLAINDFNVQIICLSKICPDFSLDILLDNYIMN